MKYIKTFEEFNSEKTSIEKDDVTTDNTEVETTNEAKQNDTKISKIDAAIANIKGQNDMSLMNSYKKAQKEIAKNGKFGNWNEEESKKMVSALKRNLKKRELIESEDISEDDETKLNEKLDSEIDNKVSEFIEELAEDLEYTEEEIFVIIKESINKK